MATWPTLGGGSVHSYQMIKGLTARGCRLFKYYGNDPNPSVTNIRKRQLLRYLTRMDAYYIRIEGRYRNEQHTIPKRLGIVRKPVVWEINSPLEERLWRNLYTRDQLRTLNRKRKAMARHVHAATAVSEELAHYAREFLGIENVLLVPNGSDPDLFDPDLRKPDLFPGYENHFKFVWAGSAQYDWQDLTLFTDMAAKLKDQSHRIVFIILAQRRHLPPDLPSKILVLEKVPYFELPAYLASCDAAACFYRPVPWEYGFYFSPLKLYDYMASELAVLGSKLGQIGRVIENGVNGLLLTGEVDEGVDMLMSLATNPEQRQSLGVQARQTVVDRYNWNRAANDTATLLRSIATR